MRRIAMTLSWIALTALIVPPALFFLGRMELDAVKGWMLAATVLWFVATPLWMERR